MLFPNMWTFSESELQNLENTKLKPQKKVGLYNAPCCPSCHFQIFSSSYRYA
uniref:Uncharacterized protein n=1 Tax=Zea mays TaxID=4577 RepID=A0A804LGF1_MAIZE